jgi:hypothetical protein
MNTVVAVLPVYSPQNPVHPSLFRRLQGCCPAPPAPGCPARRSAAPRSPSQPPPSPRAQVRTLGETVRLDARTKLLNPKWYEGMLSSGYEGVREIQKRLTNTMGWSATSGMVDNWVYDEVRRRMGGGGGGGRAGDKTVFQSWCACAVRRGGRWGGGAPGGGRLSVGGPMVPSHTPLPGTHALNYPLHPLPPPARPTPPSSRTPRWLSA